MSCQITVPDPCREDWGKMTQVEQGRHCDACSKTVVDFTGWSVENIADYLKTPRSERVCGRFRADQLNITIPFTSEQWVRQVARTSFSLLQKIALIFLLAFGLLLSACTNNVMGEAENSQEVIGDTVLSAAPLQSQDIIVRTQLFPDAANDSAAGKAHAEGRRSSSKKERIEVGEAEPEVSMGVPEFVEQPELSDSMRRSK